MKSRVIHKEQRVGVFVDVQNMYYSAKNLYDAKVSFSEVLKEAVSDRKLLRAFAYVIKAEVGAEQEFFDALSGQGYEVREKELQIFAGGAKKGDWDVGLSMDAIRLAEKVDTIVLVTGDGDFAALTDYLQNNKGCRVEVLAFERTTSSKLIEVADDFVDLSKDLKRFLINDKRTSKKD
jgi:uncharacterized LabA/DUF88 family protein